mmetsp:Transcript_41556/g.130995  ORF Transcript_41556/g.130995 Transcript_41556/m.130995 type:complete len:397 (-) Transcript_41556:335-1525(-)
MVSQPRALPSSFSSELVGMLSRFEHLEIFFGRQYASRHVLQPELPCCFPQDALTLLFDELPQGLGSSLLFFLLLQLRLLLLLVHLATLLDEPLDLAFVLQHLHPPPLRIHLLDTLVLGKLGEHSLSEFFFFRLLLLQLLQLQLLLVFVGCHHLHPVSQSLLKSSLVRQHSSLLRLLVREFDLQLEHLFLLRLSPQNVLGDLLEDSILLLLLRSFLRSCCSFSCSNGLRIAQNRLVLLLLPPFLLLFDLLVLDKIPLDVFSGLLAFCHLCKRFLLLFLHDLCDDFIHHRFLLDELCIRCSLGFILLCHLLLEDLLGSKCLVPPLLLFRFFYPNLSDASSFHVKIGDGLSLSLLFFDDKLLLQLLSSFLVHVRCSQSLLQLTKFRSLRPDLLKEFLRP